MYPNEPTQTELLNKFIADSTDLQTNKIIKSFIDEHDNSKMIEGVDYYFNKSAIKSRTQFYWKNGVRTEDKTKPNNRIPHGWHKLLVDQKTSYLVGKPITFTADDDNYAELLNDTLGEDFDDAANELVKNASNKGVEYLHPYIDEEGNFDFIITPAEQVIPLYESSKQKKLEYVIRYYPWTVNDEETIKAEWWDKQTVTYYVKAKGEFVLDNDYDVNPAPHFYYGNEGYGWGEVPFIEFKNNEEKKSDLTFYKELIDNFDLTVSDVSNNLEEIQSLVYILKGYEGTDLGEFMENLRYYKAIKTDADGGVDTAQAEVPISSIDSHLDRLRTSIFTFGQGVDIDTDNIGHSPSGIALKFLFSLLDMKANVLERKFRKGLEWIVWFATEYINMTQNQSYNYKDVRYTFNKHIPTNELEKAEIAAKSAGNISNKTILANHPWVTDVEQELANKKEEQKELMEVYPLPDIEQKQNPLE